MTIAVSEILKQVELLSAEERLELVAKLTEQVRPSTEVAPPVNAEECEGLPWFSLADVQRLPLNQTVTMRINVRYEGRGKPQPYDFGDLFDDLEGEEESCEEDMPTNKEKL